MKLGDANTMNDNELLKILINEFEENVKDKLLKISDDSIRILYFLAWLNSFLEKHGLGRIYIVRGFAVEFYTAASIRTFDVDINIVSNKVNVIRRFLEMLGERIGRGYDLSLIKLIKPIEIVPNTEIRDFIRITINDYWVYIWSLEATLVYLLAAWKYWNSEYDMYRALILWRIRGKDMSIDKLCRLAENMDVADYLSKLIGEEICRKK